MDMKVSDQGLLEIAEVEGVVPAPYRDSKGIWTWGIGHTKNAGGPDPEKMPKAYPGNPNTVIPAVIDQFRIDVVRYADRVNDAITVELEQHEFDALVSFDFNTGGIYRAQLTAAINRGDPDAARHFMGWLQPPEIKGRRTGEMNLYMTGDYAANGDKIPIWGTNGAGKLTGLKGHITGAELLAMMHSTPMPAGLPPLVDLDPLVQIATEIVAAEETLARAVAKLHPALKLMETV